MPSIQSVRARIAASDNLRGALWMLASAIGFSLMAVLVKIAGADLPAAQVAFFRCVFGLVFLLPAILRAGVRDSFATRRFDLHLARGAVGVTAMLCFFVAIANAPLADVTAITFAKPLFVIVIATLFLGEVVRWRRWTATAVGFVGVVVMIRPGQQGFDPDTLYALFGAACVAGTVALVKTIAKHDGHLTTLAWFAVLSSLVTLGPALYVWVPPSPTLWVVCALVGLVGVASQSAIVSAYRIGEATAVAPFDYSRIVFAAGFGVLLFDEWPDVWTLLGAAIVVGATIYIARREAKLGAPTADGPSQALSRKV
ncbi:MAG: DMT family transporter [Pseudomonadota bacterium]